MLVRKVLWDKVARPVPIRVKIRPHWSKRTVQRATHCFCVKYVTRAGNCLCDQIRRPLDLLFVPIEIFLTQTVVSNTDGFSIVEINRLPECALQLSG